MDQLHLVKNIPIRRGLKRSDLRRNIQGTHPLPKPKVFFSFTSDSEVNIIFSKSPSPQFILGDSSHIWEKETTTES